ncbi:MAG: hypothetical protein Q9196_003840 [Gyalolechia fulgens]
MEPLTAFSLAAGVLQVVDFSFKAIKTCRELYKDGSVAGHRETVEIADALDQASTLHSSDDLDILGQSKKCSKLAEDLTSELNKLRLDDRSLFHAITRSVKAIRRKKSLEEKRELLERYQNLVGTRIMMRLDARSLKEKHDIYQLDRRVQDLVSAVEQGQSTFAELLTKESRGIKDHVDKKFDSHVQSAEKRLARDRMLESLFFPEIVSRQEQVPEAFEGTCHWIFDTSADQRGRSRPWSNFRDWLENDEDAYWISGKPGSGKSTLMKYIVNADLTLQLLSSWKKDTDLLVVSFFFWEAGTALQKSCTGLLRSLLFQIATQWPELVDLVGAQHGNRGGVEFSKEFLPAWTDERLLSILTRFLNQKPTSVSLCAFVDGLDEFVGDEEVLLNVVRLFINTPRCKICVSSRPEPAFRDEFTSCRQLRVQDLNREDIERTVAGKLSPILTKYMPKDGRKLDSLNETLIGKAQGVFRWLDLMIRDLIIGARNRDTATMLLSRLERAPETINGMYTHILSSLDPFYQEESLKYFSVLLLAAEFGIKPDLLRLVCAEDDPWEHVVNFDLDYFHTAKFDSACRDLETRLIACCGSLIDIQEDLNDEGAEVKSNITRHGRRDVVFVHRTALEYVRETYEEKLLDPHSLVKANAHLARGCIGWLVVVAPTLHPDPIDEDFLALINATMSVISAIGSHQVTPDVDDPSVMVQLDLTNRAFHSLQDVCTFAYSIELDWFSEISIVRPFAFMKNELYLPFNDHLSGAAFFGCNHYLQVQLSSRNITEEQAENLLQSALFGFRDMVESHQVDGALAKFRTVQTVLQHKPNVEKLFITWPHEFQGIQHATLWGTFFQLLMDYYTIYSIFALESAWQVLEACSLETVEAFLSLGANPNSRIVWSEVAGYIELIIEVSPIDIIEPWMEHRNPVVTQLKARLLAAGAVPHCRLLYVGDRRSQLYYSSGPQPELSERLRKEFRLRSDIWLDDADGKILANFTEGDAMSREDVMNEIRNSSLSF